MPRTVTAGRVIPDEPPSTYYRRSLDVSNHTGMTILNKQTPAHFRYWVENPAADTDSSDLAFGRAFHCATLEPDTFTRDYVIVPRNAPPYPGARSWSAKNPGKESRAAMAWWSEFEAENAGRTQITASNYDKSQRMAESMRAHPEGHLYLLGGRREVTFRWTDEETGMKCKARADNYEPRLFLLDLKKTRDASPEGFARSITSYLYDQQAAHYCDGARATDGPVERYVIFACEDTPPYVCQPYCLDPMGEERGLALRRRALRRQAECLRTGRWPGYSDRTEMISLPTFAYYGIEEMQ